MEDEIKFLSEIQWDVERQAIGYHAEHRGQLILCRISREALQAGWPTNQGGSAEATFENHREDIEEITRDIIRRGRREADGSVGVRSDDVRHLGW